MSVVAIKRRRDGSVIWSGEADGIRDAVQKTIASGANLDDADLRDADLRDASLAGASLAGANLDGANLDGASLVDASLDGANLRGANLDGANLDDANLECANLECANLRGAKLPDGRTLDEYIEWLPAGLLTQGGKSLAEVVSAWGNHSWADCPMATAFGVHSIEDIPACYRAGAALFVALFDGKQLPRPEAT